MLAEPLKIGDKTAPNRIVNQPMECNDADEVGNPTELTFLRDGKNDLKEPDPGKKNFLYWAEKNMKQGLCDMVGIGRQSLADPLFAKKILGGKSAEVNYCLACGGCSLLLGHQAQAGCVVYFDFYKKRLQEFQRKK